MNDDDPIVYENPLSSGTKMPSDWSPEQDPVAFLAARAKRRRLTLSLCVGVFLGMLAAVLGAALYFV